MTEDKTLTGRDMESEMWTAGFKTAQRTWRLHHKRELASDE